MAVETEKYNKLVNLYDRLKDVKTMKKSAAKDYREQIKDIEDEINELVKELKGKEDGK